MRDAQGFAPADVQRDVQKVKHMRRVRLGPALLVAALMAVAAAYAVPRGLEAQSLMEIEDDPVRIADRALGERFNATLAQREIEDALANNDAHLAKSFVDLAAERHVVLDPALIEKVNAAVAESESTRHAAESFALGLVSGEPADMPGFAGTALGDLFVFGDIRDAVREGTRWATGQKADELVVGLAAVGLAITAGTYATAGAAAPARVGLSLAKAARKSARLSGELATYMGRTIRHVVDWGQLKRAITGASIAEPALAIRAARDAVNVERAGRLVDLASDVGRVQAKAGTRAAFDSLKIAETPHEMSRVAKLAEKEGSRTRAILKVLGRGAIALSFAAFDLGSSILGALFTALAFVSSLKSTTERMTLRVLRRRRERRLQRFAALTARG
jgi:hypothetical protein